MRPEFYDTYRRRCCPLFVTLRIKIATQMYPMLQLIFGNNEAALICTLHPGSTSACLSILQHNRPYLGSVWDICVDAGLKGIVCDGIKFRWFTLAFKTFDAGNLITGIHVVTFLLNYEYLGKWRLCLIWFKRNYIVSSVIQWHFSVFR